MTFQTVTPFIEYMRCQAYGKVFIWGAGVYGDAIGQLLNRNEVVWDGYYDNFLSAIHTLNGKTVNLGKDSVLDDSAVYIVAVIEYSAVIQQLKKCGIQEERMIWFEDVDFWNNLRDSVTEKDDYIKKMKKFHNIHQGKRCFIIGNGPSLKVADLEKIHNSGDISFACNAIFDCYGQTHWGPDYYCVVDALFIRDVFNEKKTVQYASRNCKYMFVRSDSALFRYNDDPDIENLVFCKISVSKPPSIYKFSEDCSQTVYTGYTATYIILQIAVYMGFTEIYLLGMDNHYSHERDENGTIMVDELTQDHASILNNCYDRWPALSIWSQMDKLLIAYKSAKQYADTHGVKIYNATRGGALEVFDRIALDNLFT